MSLWHSVPRRWLPLLAAVVLIGCTPYAPIRLANNPDRGQPLDVIVSSVAPTARAATAEDVRTFVTPTVARLPDLADGTDQRLWRRFCDWCTAQAGYCSASKADTTLSTAFHDAAQTMGAAMVAQGTADRAHRAGFCLTSADGARRASVLAAYLSTLHPDRAASNPSRTLALFTPSDALAFANAYAPESVRRLGLGATTAAKTMPSSDDLLACRQRRESETKRLRTSPAAGDRVALGVIVELRLPMALIQYNALGVQVKQRASEWVNISTLSPGSDCP